MELFSSFKEADFDESGTVDGVDLSIWESGYGTGSGATKSQGDADGDGAVSGRDFLIWQQQFDGGSSVLTSAVPEPGTLPLLGGIVGLWLLQRRK